ncbi:MAG TPA: DUF4442 domain-containing protein [Candidatus Melainabacteria bacterium]|nr:DUF4442 domain-containing protein [Candidatus Melainabacteria bacterium]
MEDTIRHAESAERGAQVPLHSHLDREHHCSRCGLPITGWHRKQCLPYEPLQKQPKKKGSHKKSGDVGKQIRTMYGICSHIPFGRKLFSRFIGYMAPYSGSIGATVERLDSAACVVSMDQSRVVRDEYDWSIAASTLLLTHLRTAYEMEQTSEVCNHLNSVHAAALVTLMFRCTRLTVTAARPNEFARFSAFNIRYIKKARGRLRAVCEGVGIPGRGQYEVPCTIYDSENEVVAYGTFIWRISSVKWDDSNHAHPAALMNLIEMSTGLALNYKLAPGSRSILTGFSMKFLGNGEGKLTAVCESSKTRVSSDGTHLVEALVSDANGDGVVLGTASWKVN